MCPEGHSLFASAQPFKNVDIICSSELTQLQIVGMAGPTGLHFADPGPLQILFL